MSVPDWTLRLVLDVEWDEVPTVFKFVELNGVKLQDNAFDVWERSALFDEDEVRLDDDRFRSAWLRQWFIVNAMIQEGLECLR